MLSIRIVPESSERCLRSPRMRSARQITDKDLGSVQTEPSAVLRMWLMLPFVFKSSRDRGPRSQPICPSRVGEGHFQRPFSLTPYSLRPETSDYETNRMQFCQRQGGTSKSFIRTLQSYGSFPRHFAWRLIALSAIMVQVMHYLVFMLSSK